VPLDLEDHPCERLWRRRRDGLSERHTPGPNKRASELTGDGGSCNPLLPFAHPRWPPAPPAALVPPLAPDRVDTMATCTNPAPEWSRGARLARHKRRVSLTEMGQRQSSVVPPPTY